MLTVWKFVRTFHSIRSNYVTHCTYSVEYLIHTTFREEGLFSNSDDTLSLSWYIYIYIFVSLIQWPIRYTITKVICQCHVRLIHRHFGRWLYSRLQTADCPYTEEIFLHCLSDMGVNTFGFLFTSSVILLLFWRLFPRYLSVAFCSSLNILLQCLHQGPSPKTKEQLTNQWSLSHTQSVHSAHLIVCAIGKTLLGRPRR